jgi:matrixin
VSRPARRAVFWVLIAAVCCGRAHAINIHVIYDYDSNNFFNTQQKKDALEAAAARYSEIITTTLTAETLSNNSDDPRIGFTHPGTGLNYEISAAANVGTDAIGTPSGSCSGCYPANEYRGPWNILANEWILYAGGRPLSGSTAGVGGTSTGLNVTSMFTDEGSHLNRNFRTVSVFQNLPMWGGSISFDSDGSTDWHFDLDTPAPNTKVDFYSIALHEIGHALGLSAHQWLDWSQHSPASQFNGTNARTAYNNDNGTSLTGLMEAGSTDGHWKDNTYDSRIFSNGSPNYVGTVGAGALQDLLMEPTANFTASVHRFELTNVDVGALRDVGWSTIPQIDVLVGDYNSDGKVDAADYIVFRKGQATGTYATWRQHFGESLGAGGGFIVPEPAISTLLSILCFAGLLANRRPRIC